MRSGLAVLLLVTLAGCSASHDRKGHGPSGDDAMVEVVDDDAEVSPTDSGKTLDDASAEGGTTSDTDAGTADASTFGVEILSPRPAAQFYAFEDVSLRGVCRGRPDQAALHASFLASGPGSSWHAEGSEVSHRFDLPGSYTVELICRNTEGEEQRAKLDLTIHPTPSIVYAGRSPGAVGEAVYATRLDQLGQATQLSPRSEALAAKIVDAQYNALSDRVLVRGQLFDGQEEILATMRPCRSAACAGQDAAYEELVPEAHACAIRRFTWSPDGRSVFASYSCGVASSGATSYWVDLSGPAAIVHALGTSPSVASFDGAGDFTAGGDVLVFQAGSELKAMDTRAADHSMVSLGSVENARWLLSPARDRVLILGDEGYVLDASALVAQGTGARTQIAYAHGAPRIFQTGDTHLVYALEHEDQDGFRSYESRLMRWDGSRDTQLCSDCFTLRCGDRIMVRDAQTGAASVLRIAEGSTSDITQTIPLPQGAPAANHLTGFDSACSLVLYHPLEAPYEPVLWDIDNGEWLRVPGATLAPDGRHLANATGILPIARSPLRTHGPVASWISGEGSFTPDGSSYLLTGQRAEGEGSYLINLQTSHVERIADRSDLMRYSADGNRLLIKLGKFDQRLVEYALPSGQELSRSARGTADWGTLHWSLFSVPGARAVAYRATLAADGLESLYRTEIEPHRSLRFGTFAHGSGDWSVSRDGSLLGMSNSSELTLWSFNAQGAAAAIARKQLDPPMDCLTFEVGADGLLCVGRGVSRLYWLDAKSGKVGELASLPATGTYWEGTRGPDGGQRGMLFDQKDYAASVSWLDFSDPAALRIEPGAEPPQYWMLTSDRRYVLRGSPTTVTDLAKGETRVLTKAHDRVFIPSPWQYHESLDTPGRIVLTDDNTLYWVDLSAAVVTASPYVGRVLTLFRLGPDLSRVLVLNERKTWLAVMGEDGERTTLYQDDVNELYYAQPSPDGRWVLFWTEEATFVVPSDGASPAIQLTSSRIDDPQFDRTGRFLAGLLLAQEGTNDYAKWKVWNLEAPNTPTVVTPDGFQPKYGYTPVWIQ